jgi:hypothetical protein
MLERRVEQIEALLQTTKNHDYSEHFDDPNSYRHIQSLPSPEFRRPSQSVGSYSTHDHTSDRNPDGIATSGQGDKISLTDYGKNLPMASIEIPRTNPCTPPSTITMPSIGPLSNIPRRSEGPLSPATTRAPIDKEESILSPDSVLSPTSGSAQLTFYTG